MCMYTLQDIPGERVLLLPRGTMWVCVCVFICLLHIFWGCFPLWQCHSVTGEVGPRQWVMLLKQKPWQQKCGESDETPCRHVSSPGPRCLLPGFLLFSSPAPSPHPPGLQMLETWTSRRGRGPAVPVTTAGANAVNCWCTVFWSGETKN